MLNLLLYIIRSIGSKQLVQFFTVLFMWSLAEGMITFYFPLHLEHELNSIVLVGILLGVSSLSSVVTDLIFGFISEISDYRKFLYIGVATYILMIPLLAFGQGIVPLLLAVVIWGFQYELVLNFGTPIFLAKHAKHSEFSKTSSVSFLIRNIGFFIGPILADYLRIDNVGILYGFVTLLLVGMLVMIYTTTTKHPGAHHKVKVRHLSLISEIKIVKNFLPEVFPFLILGFGIGVYESVFVIFGPLEFSKTTDIAGLLVAVTVLANIIVPVFAVWIIKTYKERKIILASAVVLLLASIGYMLTTSEILLGFIIFIAFSLLALIFLAKDSAFLGILSKVKSSEEDEAVSISSLGPNTAYVIVGIFGGIMMQELGFNTVVLSASAVLLVCVFIFIAFRPNGVTRTTSKVHS